VGRGVSLTKHGSQTRVPSFRVKSTLRLKSISAPHLPHCSALASFIAIAKWVGPYLPLTFLLSAQYFFMRAAILAFATALILRPCGLGRPFVVAGTMAVKARIAASVLRISFCNVVRCDFSSETIVDRFVMREFYGTVVHGSRERDDWVVSRFWILFDFRQSMQ
jgi:hypothetical protein